MKVGGTNIESEECRRKFDELNVIVMVALNNDSGRNLWEKLFGWLKLLNQHNTSPTITTTTSLLASFPSLWATRPFSEKTYSYLSITVHGKI